MNIGKVLAKVKESSIIAPIESILTINDIFLAGVFDSGKFLYQQNKHDWIVVCGYGYWDGKQISRGGIYYRPGLHNVYITYSEIWNDLEEIHEELKFNDNGRYSLGLAPILTYSRITYENTKHNQLHTSNKRVQHITN